MSKGNWRYLKGIQENPDFSPDIALHVIMFPCERTSCTLLKTRKGYVPWLSSWGKCTSGILGSDLRNPLKFDLSPGPVACYAEWQWAELSCWCPHWWPHVFQECSVIQPASLLTARTFHEVHRLLFFSSACLLIRKPVTKQVCLECKGVPRHQTARFRQSRRRYFLGKRSLATTYRLSFYIHYCLVHYPRAKIWLTSKQAVCHRNRWA